MTRRTRRRTHAGNLPWLVAGGLFGAFLGVCQLAAPGSWLVVLLLAGMVALGVDHHRATRRTQRRGR